VACCQTAVILQDLHAQGIPEDKKELFVTLVIN
jgi:hypothetical protein